MAHARRSPIRTIATRPMAGRYAETSGPTWLCLVFLLGGLLVVHLAVRAAPQGPASLGLLAQLAAGPSPERVRQGYVPPAEATPAAPFCADGQAPRFVLGFAALKARLGAAMGEPLECEHPGPDGQMLQRTTAGLAVYDGRANRASFTDGWRSWALAPGGLVAWEGGGLPPDEPVRQDAIASR